MHSEDLSRHHGLNASESPATGHSRFALSKSNELEHPQISPMRHTAIRYYYNAILGCPHNVCNCIEIKPRSQQMHLGRLSDPNTTELHTLSRSVLRNCRNGPLDFVPWFCGGVRALLQCPELLKKRATLMRGCHGPPHSISVFHYF